MTITLTREEAQQVLDALYGTIAYDYHGKPLDEKDTACDKAADVIEARLAQPEPEPVAWRTFDGEGGYDYRDYELNEDYGYWWEERHPNHKGWVQPLYTDPTPCQTCEALARAVMMDQTSHDTTPPQREWQGLTDEEIENLFIWQEWSEDFAEYEPVARAIEAKLKEKNT
jgi:hypothetical protein